MLEILESKYPTVTTIGGITYELRKTTMFSVDAANLHSAYYAWRSSIRQGFVALRKAPAPVTDVEIAYHISYNNKPDRTHFSYAADMYVFQQRVRIGCMCFDAPNTAQLRDWAMGMRKHATEKSRQKDSGQARKAQSHTAHASRKGRTGKRAARRT